MINEKNSILELRMIGSNSALFDNHDDILNKLVYFRRAAYFNRMQAIMGMVDNVRFLSIL